jgi:carbamate kinase
MNIERNTTRIVIALGGNAIAPQGQNAAFNEQYANIRSTCASIAQLLHNGLSVVITHGNGPQVGNLLIQQESAVEGIPAQPLEICDAMSQGQIGYMIQQCLVNSLRAANIRTDVVTIVSQVLVNKNDPAFAQPTKPVGPFYSEALAKRLQEQKGYSVEQVSPGTKQPFRRVVPSPEPIQIIEGNVIKQLVDHGTLVIACGGGGIPIIADRGTDIRGVDAVIDKDLGAEKLAEAVSADTLMILTDVSNVYLHFGTDDQKPLSTITAQQLKYYLREGHFLNGSMRPKVEACIRFLDSGGQRAIIASLAELLPAFEGQAGTQVIH